MYAKTQVNRQTLFSTAYQEYLQELIRHAHSMINSRELSEDLAQDAFVRMWIYLTRGGDIKKPRAFLHHVLNNVIVDTYRKHKAMSLDMLIEEGKEPSTDDSARMFDIIDGKSAFLRIEQLPETYQRVLRMKYRQGLSYREISHCTGQSKNTTIVQVHRGLKKLKNLCEPV